MDQQKQKIVIEIEFTGSSDDVQVNVLTSHNLNLDGICEEVLNSLEKADNANELFNCYEVAIAKNIVWVFKKMVLDGLLDSEIKNIKAIGQIGLGEIMKAKLNKIISEHEAGE